VWVGGRVGGCGGWVWWWGGGGLVVVMVVIIIIKRRVSISWPVLIAS
jgi:hypothetical protein